MISFIFLLLEENIKKHVYFLSNDYLEGRLCGYNQKARDYIEFHLKRYGYEVIKQEFEVEGKIKIDSFQTNLRIPIKPLYFTSSGYVKSEEFSIIDGDSFDNIGLIHKTIEEKNKNKKGVIFLLSHPISKSYFDKNLGIVALQLPKEYKDSLKNKNFFVYLKVSREKVKGENIFAVKKGKSLKYIIVGAHYDHLGYGDVSSLDTIYDIHNGADDNASGVAGVLELANYYKNRDVSDNIVFAFWDCEEVGTIGSEYYIKNPIFPLENTKIYINFDMIGRLKDSSLLIIGSKTAVEIEDILNRRNKLFKLKLSNSGIGFSDQNAFYNAKIPVLHFFTNVHQEYHRTTDDAELINYEGQKQILLYAIDVIDEILKTETLTFNKVEEEKPARISRGVRLGIIPDYTYEGEGVRISGVLKNTPAQNIGLTQGDIILKIGKYETKNIYELTYALSKFKKSQRTTILYKRDNKVMKSNIKF
ncbi:MAG: M28 family peptidase [candidate division WOR-3 bacterium]|nr:M28 family peptidase [candidate division WOR-3 bacterium]MCX7947337.1 M28 family peptidase [candidate division WOR-3 bacterium]MDW8150107.1 M28 family peptidase [candidate division WOR-3 bacterium]